MRPKKKYISKDVMLAKMPKRPKKLDHVPKIDKFLRYKFEATKST